MNELMGLEVTPVMTCMNGSDLSSRVTLNTLNVLKMRTALDAETAFPCPPDRTVISTIESATIIPSKIFILSRM